MASLPRRKLFIGLGALALTACGRDEPMTVSRTPPLAMTRLTRDVAGLAERLRPGALGVGLLNMDSGEVWSFHGDRPFPLQSVFKAPLGAAVLAEAEAGRLSLEERLSLQPMDLSPPFSPVGAAWPARRDYSVRELLVAAVAQSDNTAADVLMARIGGPGAVTAWLSAKNVEEVRIDRYERDIQTEMFGLASFRPAWKDEAAFRQVMASVEPAVRRRALAAYLADPQDTATPRGILTFLQMLDHGELLAPASRRLLLQIMAGAASGARRLKAGLPDGASFAHKTGTGRADLGVTSVVNDAGVFVLEDGRRYAVAAFLAGARLPPDDCEAALAELARLLIRGLR